MTMRRISTCPSNSLANIKGVFTDIDDTLTTDGRIPFTVFEAMENLRAHGLLMIPVTGRPAGWCDMIARTWPVDAVVGENGALAFSYDIGARQMKRLYAVDEDQRANDQQRLVAIGDEILDKVPGVRIAADQGYRETDLAIDFNEDVISISSAAVDQIVSIFHQYGATAKISSIHVNGWFGGYDKLTMTRRLMTEVFSLELDELAENFIFIGDSPNDSPMFSYFPKAVGVANLVELADHCEHLPTWITTEPRSDGFVETAEAILNAIK